jgi:hypothetical protein
MNLIVIPSKIEVVTVPVFKAMKNYRHGDEASHILTLNDLKVSVSYTFWLIFHRKECLECVSYNHPDCPSETMQAVLHSCRLHHGISRDSAGLIIITNGKVILLLNFKFRCCFCPFVVIYISLLPRVTTYVSSCSSYVPVAPTWSIEHS